MKNALCVMLTGLMLNVEFCAAQQDYFRGYKFTKADSLRGTLSKERRCYDVTFYDLNIAVDLKKKFIKGYVDIFFDATEDFTMMQIDLFNNLKINEITYYDLPLTYQRLYNSVFVHLPGTLEQGSSATIRVFYEGYPTEAKRAPWDGGFVWEKDEKGNPWVGVACEGAGASIWWPCKDHLSDEPDSMAIHVAVPRPLVAVCNGNLRRLERLDNGYNLYHWFVSYPINSYNVTLNIGKYIHFDDRYVAADGDSLLLDYYVMPYNLEKAKKHFEQVKPMLACYEKLFGKYPFWNDGFALVETKYLGMEHQGAIAYGNQYNRGYLGGMIPRDMDWDYIIVHESGHEYFGNAVSVSDHGDMWIHESFTTYMEALYVECMYSFKDAIRYLQTQKSFIVNNQPIVGPRDVNWDDFRGSDHYYKGAWMLHTLRLGLANDDQFFGLLRGFYDQFKYTTCTTDDFVRFANAYTGQDLTKILEQYLRYPSIPRLTYDLEQQGTDLKVSFRWEADVPGFDLPVMAGSESKMYLLHPVTGEVREVVLPGVAKSDFLISEGLFAVKKKGLKG
ncbi:MAG: M1 family metallopeptidase [Bacteroidetes bacterium]|nr:M1 family metallopeptidase [Bacteroidota bacterium]